MLEIHPALAFVLLPAVAPAVVAGLALAQAEIVDAHGFSDAPRFPRAFRGCTRARRVRPSWLGLEYRIRIS